MRLQTPSLVIEIEYYAERNSILGNGAEGNFPSRTSSTELRTIFFITTPGIVQISETRVYGTSGRRVP